MDREQDLLRAFATRVAQFVSSPDESRAVRSLYLTGILSPQSFASRNRFTDLSRVNPMSVGVWRKSGEAPEAPFLRRKDRIDQWVEWARRERIEPKRTKWRVALLGESVARGYLYDPEFNVASSLGGILQSHLGAAEIDVVDLAKSSLVLQQLKVLIGQSLAVEPDVIIIFAGNNWHRHLSESDVPYVDSLLRSDGVPGLKAYMDAQAEQATRQLIAEVHALLNPKGIPVIWVIPEFNLADWFDPISDAPILVGARNREWRALRQHASTALAACEYMAAEAFATKMVALDGGTNSVPLRVLAECSRARGDLRSVRRYLEMCRDAEGWDPSFAYSPRISASIQNALREAASVPKNVVVDLPRIFEQYQGDVPPDRRLFFDYCHLTAEGISVATAAVASEVIPLLTNERPSAQNLRLRSSGPSEKVEGKAAMLAAIHNAHFFQSYELVRHWCRRAVRFWPDCAKIMTRFLDLQTRRSPFWACKSAIELAVNYESDTMGILLRGLLRGGKKRLDLMLGDVVAETLRSAGLEFDKELSVLRMQEHSLRSGPKELTEHYYCSTALGPLERAWTSQSFPTNRGSHTMYTTAFLRDSKFVFFGEKRHPVSLRLTYRVPASPKPGETIKIVVNGHRMAEAQADRTWQTLEFSILSHCVVDGLNEIVIRWPENDEDAGITLARTADTLAARRVPPFHCVFGEVHSLLAFTPAGIPPLWR